MHAHDYWVSKLPNNFPSYTTKGKLCECIAIEKFEFPLQDLNSNSQFSPPQLNVLPLSYDAPYYYYCKTLWCSLKMSRSRYCYASIEIFVLVALSLFYWILLILHSEYWKSFISDILYFFLDKLLEPIGEGCFIQRKISGPNAVIIINKGMCLISNKTIVKWLNHWFFFYRHFLASAKDLNKWANL